MSDDCISLVKENAALSAQLIELTKQLEVVCVVIKLKTLLVKTFSTNCDRMENGDIQIKQPCLKDFYCNF